MVYPVLAEARSLNKRNFACVGVNLSAGPRGKKVQFKSGWQLATTDTYMQYLDKADNGLAINTGDQSDLIVLDVDVAKPDDTQAGRQDGTAVMEALIQRHGLAPTTPIQITGSGGRHMLFSLSRSLEHGLHAAKNATKLRVDGCETTIDVRGDGGCIIVFPSKYESTGGITKSYRWETPPGMSGDLDAMPQWMISLLNGGLKRRSVQESLITQSNTKRHLTITTEDAGDAYFALTSDIVREVVGPIGKTWSRAGGFDFAPQDRTKPCGLCGEIHTSNNYFVRRIISTCCTLRNYSSRCRCTKVLGEDDVQALTNLAAAPCLDDRIIDILRLVIRDQGHDLVYTGQQWLIFQGLIWENVSDMEIKRRLKVDVNYNVIELLIKCLVASKVKPDPKNPMDMLTNLRRTHGYLMKSGNVSSVAESGKILRLDEQIAGQLNTNKDIIAAANGVIDLKTGQVREARCDDYLSRNISTNYRGMDHPTPTVDAFFASIFNDDPQVISFMQRLLGYAITGHTKQQCWAIWTGAGSNGKSLLLDCLNDLLGPEMYCTPAKEVFFQGGRQAAAGGHTAHLAPLQGKLIVAREERNETDKLDSELIKLMTGEGTIVSRAPYSAKYVNFKPTHLPILACNSLPPIDVDDAAMLRRLIVVPFVNIYTGEEDRVPYDPSNPHHRLKDPDLREKMMMDENREQLLTWLVRGAVEWYEKGLGVHPPLLKNALQGYVAENDVLQRFIDEHYELGARDVVNAAEFRSEFTQTSGRKVSQKELQEMMSRRGFTLKTERVSGKHERVYRGLCRCRQC